MSLPIVYLLHDGLIITAFTTTSARSANDRARAGNAVEDLDKDGAVTGNSGEADPSCLTLEIARHRTDADVDRERWLGEVRADMDAEGVRRLADALKVTPSELWERHPELVEALFAGSRDSSRHE